MTHIEYVSAKRTQLVDAVRAMMSGELDLIKGCRIVSALSDEIEPTPAEAEVLKSFMFVAYETADYPIDEVRQRFCPGFLSQLDQSRDEYLNRNRSLIYRDCNQVIATFSRSH